MGTYLILAIANIAAAIAFGAKDQDVASWFSGTVFVICAIAAFLEYCDNEE